MGCFCRSEVRIDVVLRTAQPCLQSCYKWVLTDLHQSRRSCALFVNNGRTSRNDRFFRYSVKITRPTLHVGSGFVQFVPVHLWKGKPGVWFDRFCFCLFHTRLHLSRGSRFFVLPARPLWAICYE